MFNVCDGKKTAVIGRTNKHNWFLNVFMGTRIYRSSDEAAATYEHFVVVSAVEQ